MTQVDREQLEGELYLAGVRDPKKLRRVVTVIEAHIYARVSNILAREEAETHLPDPGKRYKCSGEGMCGQYKPLEEFPEDKRRNPRLARPCTWCSERRVTKKDVHYGQEQAREG